ncbi:hypothetical protein ARMSODRAFT_978189 [Armillaria solidipes]|uniref:Uncharacterized protein n=1 Tax=Armillaria solidipes TaxID=1076256 RepID=A0A2H3BMF2_9AGAR|nr:hypothetical protein ARMSODRAFT_978189 [Armillaria solidipes]
MAEGKKAALHSLSLKHKNYKARLGLVYCTTHPLPLVPPSLRSITDKEMDPNKGQKPSQELLRDNSKADKDACDKVEQDTCKKAEKMKSNGKEGFQEELELTTSEMAPNASFSPQCSVHTGKGENPNNYKLAAGNYKGK